MNIRTAAGCWRWLLFVWVGVLPLRAQDSAKRDTASIGVVGTKETVGMSVMYDRAAVPGRTVLGELSCPIPFILGDLKVPAGKYALWTVPTPTGVTLILSRDKSSHYDRTADAGRVALVVDTLYESADTLTISFSTHRKAPDTLTIQYDVAQSAAMHGTHYTVGFGPGATQSLVIRWGKFRWSLPVKLQ